MHRERKDCIDSGGREKGEGERVRKKERKDMHRDRVGTEAEVRG